MNKWDTVFKVGLILCVIALLYAAVVLVSNDYDVKISCIKAGYTDKVYLNGIAFCYKINPATLTLFDSLAK